MRSAAAALRAIDNDASRAGQQAQLAQSRATTPELRLLQKHNALMGLDDAKRLARLDPKQHAFGCRCAVCDQTEKPCPIDDCATVCKGNLRLAAHLEQHTKKARKAAQTIRRHVEPVGLTFIANLLGDPNRAARIDLRDLRTFAERIEAASGTRYRRARMGSTRNALQSILDDPKGSTVLSCGAPNSIAGVVYRLALVAGVSPRAVMLALVSWGIERFAQDVRKVRAATPPHVAKTLAFPEGETA